MPHISDRKRMLKAIAAKLESRRQMLASSRAVATVTNLARDNEGEHNEANTADDSLNEVIECHELLVDTLQLTYNDINSKRFLAEQKPYRTGLSHAIFERDLQHNNNNNNNNGSPPWLMEEEFLQKYQMHQSNFNQLVSPAKIIPCFTPTQIKTRPNQNIDYCYFYIIWVRLAAAQVTPI
jgi:hypothetical protein